MKKRYELWIAYKVRALKKLLDKYNIVDTIHLQSLCTDKSYLEKKIKI